jgi:FtsH-binding integral membrane protein
VLLIYVPGRPPLALVFLTLALALYLTVVELRELRPHYVWWFWWLIVVSLTHFVGYLALRVYALVRRRREARA